MSGAVGEQRPGLTSSMLDAVRHHDASKHCQRGPVRERHVTASSPCVKALVEASFHAGEKSNWRARAPTTACANDCLDATTPAGLRDRALVGLMIYRVDDLFVRAIGAALAMRVEDVFVQNRRLWVRLHEKGGKLHEMPCHHNLEECLTAYIDGCDLREDRKGPLFRTIARGTGRLSEKPPSPKLAGFRWCGGARKRPRSRRRSATIRFGQPGSPPI